MPRNPEQKRAAHVQAAIAAGQAKLAEAVSGRPMAPHVQAAMTAAQPRVAGSRPGDIRQPATPHSPAAGAAFSAHDGRPLSPRAFVSRFENKISPSGVIQRAALPDPNESGNVHNRKAPAKSGASDKLYVVKVRARPVSGMGGPVATHCFLVLVDLDDNVQDSLSFDPSNSVGSGDGNPTNKTRGEEVVGIVFGNDMTAWNVLKERYATFGQTEYSLHNHNCCHAAIYALSGSSLDGANQGIIFARSANKAWDDAHWQPSAETKIKKDQ